MSVVKITGDGGQIRSKTWSHASVRAELTNATPEEAENVRHLVRSIVAIVSGTQQPSERKSIPSR